MMDTNAPPYTPDSAYDTLEVRILKRLDNINHRLDQLMAYADELRASMSNTTAALDALPTLITSERDQVRALLDELVAATGNQVTEADVTAGRAIEERLAAIATAVSGIAPDAPAEPPAEPPVEPPAEPVPGEG